MRVYNPLPEKAGQPQACTTPGQDRARHRKQRLVARFLLFACDEATVLFDGLAGFGNRVVELPSRPA